MYHTKRWLDRAQSGLLLKPARRLRQAQDASNTCEAGVLSFSGSIGNAMNEDAISEQTAELRDILRRRGPDIEWHTVHCDHDHEGVLWVRVRAMRTERLVQFVLLVLDSEGAKTTAIAARIIGEALRLLRNKN